MAPDRPAPPQIRPFLATMGRHRLNGSVAFTTTDPDDRAFLVTAARHHGFTYTEAAAQVTPHRRLGTHWRPGSAGEGRRLPSVSLLSKSMSQASMTSQADRG